VLAVAGIVTSIIAVCNERWDARCCGVISDVGHGCSSTSRPASAYFARTKRGEILSRFSIDLSAFEGSIKSFSQCGAAFFELTPASS